MRKVIMIQVKYQGEGEFFHRVPRRDLTVDEWEALDSETQKLIKKSKLYEVLKKPEEVVIASESSATVSDDNATTTSEPGGESGETGGTSK